MRPGGRWDGDIRADATIETEWGALVPEEIQRNMVLVREIPANFVPWAVLTPDGKWHGGGGDADKDMDAWTVEQATIFADTQTISQSASTSITDASA